LIVEAFEFNTNNSQELNSTESKTTQVALANKDNISKEKKSLLVSILKDVANEL
jgi:hypothetical protein